MTKISKEQNEENNKKIEQWKRLQYENHIPTNAETIKWIKDQRYIISKLRNEEHNTCIHEIAEQGNIDIGTVINTITHLAINGMQILDEILEITKYKDWTEKDKIEEIKNILE